MEKHINQAMIYAAAIAFTKGISILMVPFVTRYLSTAEYGVLEILISIADLGSIVLGLGLTDTLFRFAGAQDSKKEKAHLCASVFGLSLCIALISIPITQLFAPLIAGSFAIAVDLWDVRLILFTLTLTGCIQVPLGWMRMQNQAWRFFQLMVAKGLLQAMLIVGLMINGMGVTAIIMGGAIIDILFTLILTIIQYRTTGIHFDPRWNKKLIAYGGPLIIVGIAGFVMGSLDRWFLANHITPDKLAEYGLAAKFGMITFLLVEPFNMWWFPRRFNVLYGENGIAKSTLVVNIGVSFTIFMAACIAIGGPIAVYLLTPPSYHGAMLYIPALALITALNVISNIMNIGAYAQKTGVVPALINIGSAVVALIGYIYLIPLYGVNGTLIATVTAFFVRFLLFYVISQKKIYLPYASVKLSLIAIMAIGGGWTLMPLISSPLQYFLYGTVFLLVLLFTIAALQLIPLQNFLSKRMKEAYVLPK